MSYEKQIFINHCTEDAYHFIANFSHHWSVAVYAWRHLNDKILAILQTNGNIDIFLYILHSKLESAGLLKCDFKICFSIYKFTHPTKNGT